ncbi:hypothetical protein BT63DRAFT_471697 [Microthyrium microscopicum]|uniref:RING-type domain-containing protein n=1 Tax=Microthyrium microscopicum TaxID=703497 RepID=A0A6A6UCE1_9PEZI|nr:hypothetical protein BT63DRAFT_471697 [Microthyrium microscopicum]
MSDATAPEKECPICKDTLANANREAGNLNITQVYGEIICKYGHNCCIECSEYWQEFNDTCPVCRQRVFRIADAPPAKQWELATQTDVAPPRWVELARKIQLGFQSQDPKRAGLDRPTIRDLSTIEVPAGFVGNFAESVRRMGRRESRQHLSFKFGCHRDFIARELGNSGHDEDNVCRIIQTTAIDFTPSPSGSFSAWMEDPEGGQLMVHFHLKTGLLYTGHGKETQSLIPGVAPGSWQTWVHLTLDNLYDVPAPCFSHQGYFIRETPLNVYNNNATANQSLAVFDDWLRTLRFCRCTMNFGNDYKIRLSDLPDELRAAHYEAAERDLTNLRGMAFRPDSEVPAMLAVRDL